MSEIVHYGHRVPTSLRTYVRIGCLDDRSRR
jgi:hypothetical protein